MEAALAQRLTNLNNRASELRGARSSYVARLEELKVEITELEEKSLLLTKTAELFRFLLDRLIYKGVESISEIVSEGLQAIFDDQDLSFRGDISTKRGLINVDFKTIDHEKGNEGDALEAFGGGVSAVESLILRLLIILKTGLARVVLLDESLAALSADYDENATTFIKELCDKLGLDLLLITHKKQYLDLADNAYQAEAQADGVMTLRKIK